MRLSEDKVRHLSHVIYDALVEAGAMAKHDDAAARREIKGSLTRWLRSEEEVEEAVRRKVLSYSRKVLEGSPEWDVLYRKHYQEEMERRGRR